MCFTYDNLTVCFYYPCQSQYPAHLKPFHKRFFLIKGSLQVFYNIPIYSYCYCSHQGFYITPTSSLQFIKILLYWLFLLFSVSSNLSFPLTPTSQQILSWFGILKQGINYKYFIWEVIPGNREGNGNVTLIIGHPTTGLLASGLESLPSVVLTSTRIIFLKCLVISCTISSMFPITHQV